MGTVTIRIRSIAWFTTGAIISAAVVLMFVNALSADASPGEDDSTFVGITPCRLADTRPAPDRVGAAATLGAAETQTFAAVGDNGDCSIPSAATAVSLNVTALKASALSFLTFWPTDAQRPLAASLNPAPGQPPVPNAVTVDLSNLGSFNVYNEAGNVDIVIDINGYFTQTSLKDLHDRVAALETAHVDQNVLNQEVNAAIMDRYTKSEVDTLLAQEATAYWAVVDSAGALVGGTPGASSVQLFKPTVDGSYEVDFGTDVTNCVLTATLGRPDSANLDPDEGEIGTAYRNGEPSAVYVKTLDSSGTDADHSFHLLVIC